MPSLTIGLDEELSDQRSNQVAYKLSIENTSTQVIHLQSVNPQLPSGATLHEVTDISLAQTSARRASLITELNDLLRGFLWVSSEDFRKVWVQQTKDTWNELLNVSFAFRLYAAMLTFRFASIRNLQAEVGRRYESSRFKILSTADARAAYQRWMQNAKDPEIIRSMFEAKLEQLERIEEQLGEVGLTAIEPGSRFSATYVIRFIRGVLEPRKYEMAFNATFLEKDDPTEQSSSTATNVQISPHPLSLSIVAAISAVLGVLLRGPLGGASKGPLTDLLLLAQSGELLIAPVLAIIFFNVYEYTSVGKELKIGVSWRSALLIGALCGLAQDRVLAALKALIGA
jgi:hypothetical protein